MFNGVRDAPHLGFPECSHSRRGGSHRLSALRQAHGSTLLTVPDASTLLGVPQQSRRERSRTAHRAAKPPYRRPRFFRTPKKPGATVDLLVVHHRVE